MLPTTHLPLLEQVRTRTGMYLGGVGELGLQQMLCGVISAFLAMKSCNVKHASLSITADREVQIELMGTIAPVDTGVWLLRDGCSDEPTFGLGLACALSETLAVKVTGNGCDRHEIFSRGRFVAGEGTISECASAVWVRWVGDSAIFPEMSSISFLSNCRRVQELAIFHPSCGFSVNDQRLNQHRDYRYPNGLMSYLEEADVYACRPNDPKWTSSATHIKLVEGDEYAEAVILESAAGGRAANLISWVNGTRTKGNGSHWEGLKRGCAEVLEGGEKFWVDYRLKYFDDALGGATVLLAVQLNRPEYRSPTRDVLREDPRAEDLVYRMAIEQLEFVGSRFRKRTQGR